MFGKFLTATAFALVALVPFHANASEPTVQNAAAPTTIVTAPYMAAKPADGIYDIVILGDSLADGLHQGLTQLNKDDDTFRTVKKSKVNTGLVRSDRYDWNKAARKISQSGKYDIAIVQLGLNDLQSIREKGKKHHYPSDGWKERYIARAKALADDLKASGLTVYWTGIPIVSQKSYPEDYAFVNGILADVARQTGVKFVDTWTPLADAKGEFSPYHKDADGKTQEIRNRDGVHFTPSGYLIFAGIVDDAIKADIAAMTASN
ncbi:DUF459 domain-containing protein [Ahrensia sp. R2A130]|uniref:SGNH/GDSL hydrolase family protein n=1 Tax=Ahrensia sp. R2A130 TaxID=744979 RepID=UPI0001E0E8E0|nr:DUF459 domain-containing protein [Ahrensia sp. R2A130]EFL87994.1 conserved hypothetical protein [Ahrensia sp. R2A130]